jgi:hypothetical protein
MSFDLHTEMDKEINVRTLLREISLAEEVKDSDG